METPSSNNIPSDEWRPGLEFQFDLLDEEDVKWLKWQDHSLNDNSSFVVTSTIPNKDGYLDGVDIVAQEKTSGVQVRFTNHSCISSKAVRL